MRHALLAAALALSASACSKEDPPLTPEEAVAQLAPGTAVTVQGQVFTTTFDATLANGDYAVTGDRYLLVRTVVPNGVVTSSGRFVDDPVRAFGLGVRLPREGTRGFLVPQIGDTVRVTGVLRRVAWNQSRAKGTLDVPVLEEVSELTVVRGAPALKLEDATCRHDLECADHLICDRATTKCVAPPPNLTWGNPFRNVNGTCEEDADCPLGQTCDLVYTVKATGDYAPHYAASRDIGRGLCVLPDGATPESACPRVGTATDLVGGRYSPGKEVCVRGELLLNTLAEDNDTHSQMVVPEALPYPEVLPNFGYWIFGGTTEISPPHKDPARPQGALADPPLRKVYTAIGTVRWDDSHGWYEVHPIKQWWLTP
jgi:hypothetical protein